MLSPLQPYHILIVDDEANMRNLLRIHLKRQGYQVSDSPNGEHALKLLQEQRHDLVILDIMMPGLDGWKVTQIIRESMHIPILLLTARSDTKDIVTGLSLGADDYLSKPFEPDELLARVSALLRRSQLHSPLQIEQRTALHFKSLTIDVDSREVSVNGQLIDLTPKEFDVLRLFAANPQRVYEREIIVEQLWGFEYDGDNRSVDTHVKNIRMKMEQAQLNYNPIQTVWGVGYRFNTKDASYET